MSKAGAQTAGPVFGGAMLTQNAGTGGPASPSVDEAPVFCVERAFQFWPISVSLHLLLLLNFALAAYLTGLIWTVQVVHYPGLALLGQAEFPRYHAAHTRRMGYVAGAPMLLELALAAGLAWAGRGALPHAAGWWSLGLVAVAWAGTFFVAVPFHNRLAASGYDYIAIDGLTRTNWLRTLAWTARLLLLGGLLA